MTNEQGLVERLRGYPRDVHGNFNRLEYLLTGNDAADKIEQQNATIEATSAQIADLKRALDTAQHRATQNGKWLGELLAVIHRDGGHYQATHGDEKAVADAHAVWASLQSALDTARHDAMEEADELDAATAALVALAEAGIPTDIQELLVRGDPLRGIAPGALSKCFQAAIRAFQTKDQSHGA